MALAWMSNGDQAHDGVSIIFGRETYSRHRTVLDQIGIEGKSCLAVKYARVDTCPLDRRGVEWHECCYAARLGDDVN